MISSSHIFTKVEEKSNEIWKFQMYFLTMEFDNKTALVPPLSIIHHIYLCFKWLARKTCCTKRSEGNFWNAPRKWFFVVYLNSELCAQFTVYNVRRWLTCEMNLNYNVPYQYYWIKYRRESENLCQKGGGL